MNNLKLSEKDAFIIGTGPSTAKLLKHKHLLNNFTVIGLNFSIKDFEENLDYHIVMEKEPNVIYNYMKNNPYREDLPRIINKIPLRFFPKDANLIPAVRCDFKHKPSLRSYTNEFGSGLFSGYITHTIRQPASVCLQALHLAGILGCKNVYTIGCDFLFQGDLRYYTGYDNKDHKSNISTSIVRPKNIVEVDFCGEKRLTAECYKNTADWTNRFIKEVCRPEMEVYDFSGGLLTAAIQLNLEEFMGKYENNI